MGEAWEKLRKLDAFGKVNEDFYTRTLSGGVITLVSSIIMAILFFTELRELLLDAVHTCTREPVPVQTSPTQDFSCTSESLIERTVGLLLCTGLFLTVRTDSHLSVDTSRGEKLQINVRFATIRMHVRHLICATPRNWLHASMWQSGP